VQRDEERHETAPVVTDEPDPVELERVEQGEEVARELLLGVGGARSVGPTEAAQVGAHHAVVLGEPRDHVPPAVPVLRPAVHQDDRITGARLGNVQAHIPGLDEAVLDTRDAGERGHRVVLPTGHTPQPVTARRRRR